MSFKRKTIFSILAICPILLIASCGGDSPGGGSSEFKTTTISASASTTRLESDVLTGNTCSNGISTGGHVSTDTVNIDFTSTIYSGVSSSLPVAIDSYTVTFTPNASMSTAAPPALASVSGTLIGQTITAGGKLTVPVTVAPEAFKSNLLNSGIISACSGTVYAYYALITFQAIEVGTGTRNTIGPISLDVVFADRI